MKIVADFLMALLLIIIDFVKEHLIELLLVTSLIGLGWGLWGVFVLSSAEHKRLMQQCMDDGHKEYECYSMLKDNATDHQRY